MNMGAGGASLGSSAKTEFLQKPSSVMAFLIVSNGPRSGYLWHLNPAITSIGRNPESDIIVSDDEASWDHAKIRQETEEGPDGSVTSIFYLYDIVSTNGVFVNDKRVYRHPLADNDLVEVGETQFIFRRPAGSA
jgi:pSer/pThr/pTyr-binding forkhead associated (FHA) protein